MLAFPSKSYNLEKQESLRTPVFSKGYRFLMDVVLLSLFVSSEDVQCGQQTASAEISLLQYGHTFVAAAASSISCGFLTFLESEFIIFTIMKIINAMMMKLITSVRKVP